MTSFIRPRQMTSFSVSVFCITYIQILLYGHFHSTNLENEHNAFILPMSNCIFASQKHLSADQLNYQPELKTLWLLCIWFSCSCRNIIMFTRSVADFTAHFSTPFDPYCVVLENVIFPFLFFFLPLLLSIKVFISWLACRCNKIKIDLEENMKQW